MHYNSSDPRNAPFFFCVPETRAQGYARRFDFRATRRRTSRVTLLEPRFMRINPGLMSYMHKWIWAKRVSSSSTTKAQSWTLKSFNYL